jgi:hypothetical protein
MVTSATKAARLVQSGELVGMGVSGVVVALTWTDGVSVAVGASIAVAARVSVSITAGTAVSTGDCAPHAEVINTTKRKTTSDFFLIKTSILFEATKKDYFIIYKK